MTQSTKHQWVCHVASKNLLLWESHKTLYMPQSNKHHRTKWDTHTGGCIVCSYPEGGVKKTVDSGWLGSVAVSCFSQLGSQGHFCSVFGLSCLVVMFYYLHVGMLNSIVCTSNAMWHSLCAMSQALASDRFWSFLIYSRSRLDEFVFAALQLPRGTSANRRNREYN